PCADGSVSVNGRGAFRAQRELGGCHGHIFSGHALSIDWKGPHPASYEALPSPLAAPRHNNPVSRLAAIASLALDSKQKPPSPSPPLPNPAGALQLIVARGSHLTRPGMSSTRAHKSASPSLCAADGLSGPSHDHLPNAQVLEPPSHVPQIYNRQKTPIKQPWCDTASAGRPGPRVTPGALHHGEHFQVLAKNPVCCTSPHNKWICFGGVVQPRTP
ncbi:unnamed protein product, partial [Pleuronectes platessa]